MHFHCSFWVRLLEKIGKSSFRLLASPQSSQEKFHHPAGTVQGCSSIWGYKFYSINSIIVVVFIILLIVTALVTVALTYFQLAAEDHQWWWRYTYIFIIQSFVTVAIFFYCTESIDPNKNLSYSSVHVSLWEYNNRCSKDHEEIDNLKQILTKLSGPIS